MGTTMQFELRHAALFQHMPITINSRQLNNNAAFCFILQFFRDGV
jgi:hypothetical protein